MTQQAGFFKAFFGSCCGRDIFYTLRTHSWGRCLWHLFLLSLIIGIIIGNVNSGRTEGRLRAAETVFTSVFGEEVFVNDNKGSWNWVSPVKDPQKPREISLPGGSRFYYTGTSRRVPDSVKSVTGAVFVWSPDALGAAIPVGQGSCNCVIINTATGKVSQFKGTLHSMEELFKKAPVKLPDSLSKMQKEKVGLFFSALSVLFSVFSIAGSVVWNFFIALLYTGIFMGMYRLLNGPSGRLRFLTLREMWKCGIYAAFPAMAVASLFPILELPLLAYETVFMIGLLVYWMAVIARLERTPTDDEVNNANYK